MHPKVSTHVSSGGHQFGFDGSNKWMGRRDSLFRTLRSNPKAKFVTRAVQFGSEPLFDAVLLPGELAEQVLGAKKSLSGLGIPITVSELAYGYQERGGAQDVLDAIDVINIHMLPFFAQTASTGKSFQVHDPSDLGSENVPPNTLTQGIKLGPWFSTTWIGLSRAGMERRCILTRCAFRRGAHLGLLRQSSVPERLAIRDFTECSTQQSQCRRKHLQ
jgi:hypothetical protein